MPAVDATLNYFSSTAEGETVGVGTAFIYYSKWKFSGRLQSRSAAIRFGTGLE